jgi:thiol-disulfide isomerase/thioredoxin
MSRHALIRSTFAGLLAIGLCLAALPAHSASSSAPLKVLVFWGSWCSNCPEVMRQMEALRKQYAGHNVEFVAVSLEGEPAPAKYLQQKGYGFHLKTNGDALLARYQAVGVPWVVITDAQGNSVANPSRHDTPLNVVDDVRMELDLRT